MIDSTRNEHVAASVAWKAIVAASAAALLWTVLHARTEGWLAGLVAALVSTAVFRFLPPRPGTTPRRDAWIAFTTAIAGAAAGWAVARWL